MATGMCDFNQTLQAMSIAPSAIGGLGVTGVTGVTGTVSAQLVTRYNRPCLTSSSSFTVGVTGGSTYGGSWVVGGCGMLTGRIDPVTDLVTGVSVTPVLSGQWPLQASPCVGQSSQTRWSYTLTSASLAALSCGTYRVSGKREVNTKGTADEQCCMVSIGFAFTEQSMSSEQCQLVLNYRLLSSSALYIHTA